MTSPLDEALAALTNVHTRWEVRGGLGRGGMGVVERVHDGALDRDVAVKILRSDRLRTVGAVLRFADEAQITAQLEHPAIVPVHGFAEIDGRPAYVMRLIEGESLARLLRRGRMRKAQCLTVLERVAEAVAHAHGAGVVHRDLKPANVMIGPFGDVQLVDWGCAKVLVRDEAPDPDSPEGVSPSLASGSSVSGSVLGTPGYMPPEQARGEVDRVDRRSDVFALGAMLCEILTGHPPYPGTSEEALEAARAGGPHVVWGEGAPELVALAERCLQEDRDARPSDAGAFLAALRHAAEAWEDRERNARLAVVHAREAAARSTREADRLTAEAHADRRRLLAEEARRRARRRRLQRTAARTHEVRRRGRWLLSLAALILGAAIVAGVVYIGHGYADARRARRLDTASDEALDESTRLAQRGKLEEAVAALRPVAPTRPRVAQELARLAARLEAARAAERRREDLRALRTSLEPSRRIGESAGYDRKMVEAAGRYGLDPAHPDVEKARERLGGAAAARFLDGWARSRRTNRAYLDPEQRSVAPLLDMARALDPDPHRNRLRDAVADGDEETMRAMARELDPAEVPPETLSLLARSLREERALGAARRLLDAAILEHPQSIDLVREQAFLLVAMGRHDEALPWAWARALASRDTVFPWNSVASIASVQGRYELAHWCLDCANSVQPDHTDTLEGRAALLVVAGRYAEALGLVRRMEVERPDLPIFRVRVACALLAMGRVREGVAKAEAIVKTAPRYPRAQEALAWARTMQGRHEDAAAAARRAVELDPRFLAGWCRLADAEVNAGRAREGLATAQRAVALAPDSAFSYVVLAKAQMALGDPRARRSKQDALRLDPSVEGTLLENEVLDHVRRSAWPEVVSTSRRLVQVAPNDVIAWQNLGAGLENTGDLDGALQAWRKALDLDPTFGCAQYSIGVLLFEQGRPEAARESLEAAVRNAPWLANAHYALGKVMEKSDPKAALGHFLDAIEQKPDFVLAHQAAGLLLQFDRRLREAIEHYTRAAAADSEYVPCRWNMGWARLRLGEVAGALEAFDQVAALNPTVDGLEGTRATLRRVLALMKGPSEPAESAAALAGVLMRGGAPLVGMRLFEIAEKRKPEMFRELVRGYRFNAAVSALRAAAERFTDDAEDARLRSKALSWLQDELALCRKLLADPDAMLHAQVRTRLGQWLKNPDLARMQPQDGAKGEASEAWASLLAEARRLTR